MAGRKGQRKPNQLLLDMRWVARNPKGSDRTEGQKLCRELREKDGAEFHRRLQMMERDFLAFGKRKVVSQDAGTVVTSPSEKKKPEEVDQGTERALGLIDELLAEWEESEGVG